MIRASKQPNPRDQAMFKNGKTSTNEVTELSTDRLDNVHGGLNPLTVVVAVGLNLVLDAAKGVRLAGLAVSNMGI
jgi:hypothetical protein